MRVKSKSTLTLAMLLSVGVVLTYSIAMVVWKARSIARNANNIMEVAHAIDGAIHYHERSYREQEGWEPRDFFETPQAIQACDVISKRAPKQLRELVNSGLNVNLSGNGGMTLLYWAFVDDNLDAFNQLLAAGANPDKKLTNSIRLENRRPFFYGDSILFTSMRKAKWEFFFAALEYTRDVNQLDAAGNTLLLVCMGPEVISSTSEETLQRIIDSGISLDAQDKYGCTASESAIIWNRPLLCLRILQSGEESPVQSKVREDVAKLLSSRVTRSDQNASSDVERLKDWLDSQSRSNKPGILHGN